MIRNKNLTILIGISLLYLFLSLTFIGKLIFYPIEILVAFLHEFGHATAAIISGGHVYSLRVNPDGSGLTITSGGNKALICMGGYVGSCVFSNLLMRFSLSSISKITCAILALAAIFSGFYWFSNITNLTILCVYAAGFLFISRFSGISSLILQFIGVACTIHIILDFRIGPSSDIAQFQSVMGIFPYTAWMCIWLIIAVGITYVNVSMLSKQESTVSHT